MNLINARLLHHACPRAARERPLTRDPVIDVSTSIATHSRVQSSMFRQRRRLPSAKPSLTKPIDQLMFAVDGFAVACVHSDAFTLAPPHQKACCAIQPIDS